LSRSFIIRYHTISFAKRDRSRIFSNKRNQRDERYRHITRVDDLKPWWWSFRPPRIPADTIGDQYCDRHTGVKGLDLTSISLSKSSAVFLGLGTRLAAPPRGAAPRRIGPALLNVKDGMARVQFMSCSVPNRGFQRTLAKQQQGVRQQARAWAQHGRRGGPSRGQRRPRP
jgi:hypothetical protein